MSVTATIRIQQADFDVAQEIAALSKGRTDVGAIVSFSGICRGSENDEPIAALTLEHYPGMAEAEIAATPTRRCRAGRCRASLSFTGSAASHRV